jgi:Ca2+-binding EF-hand superfamily protein
MGVFASYEEIELFIKRYDKNRDGTLRFSEFSDAFIP